MTEPTQNKSGSLWRPWDLHLHCPGTKLSNAYGDPSDDDVWNRYIDNLETSPVQVFGITDYFSCDTFFELVRRYEARKPDSKKVFFPNIELRLAQTISADGSHPDIHVIFDNDPSICGRDQLVRFLTHLETQSTDTGNVKRSCSDLQSPDDFAAATVTLDDLLEALRRTFGKANPYLLVFPANNDGMRSTDKSSPRKVALADRIDRECQIFFGNQRNTDFFLRDDRYETGRSNPKPVVCGSDAHSFADLERLSGDVPGFPGTWIKADTTFNGLKQITYEPESRVFIGSQPDVLTRQEQDKTKFLNKLRIDQIDGYDERNGRWFKGIELPLNPELTAIIGNKGSGKSAIVDIIGLLGESRQENYFSFLIDDQRSKKFRQKGFAENFSASLEWFSNTSSQKLLSENCNRDKPEAVRYLPQNYFEQLTNEIEIEEFRKEIEDVVFSHVDETEKLGKTSFAELEELKTQQCKQEISELKKRLRELNIEIVHLEERSSPEHRRKLESRIENKKLEIAALDSAMPQEIEKPDPGSEEQSKTSDEIDDLLTILSSLRNRTDKTIGAISELKITLQEVTTLRDSLTVLEANLRTGVDELGPKFSALGLSPEKTVSLTIDYKSIQQKIDDLSRSISNLEEKKLLSVNSETDFTAVFTLPDLNVCVAHVDNQMKELKEKLSAPQRRYQTYLERINDWQEKRLELVGTDTNSAADTLNALERSLRYLNESVEGTLLQKYAERRVIVERIFSSKCTVLAFYSDLKNSVEGQFESARARGFEIQIDASFIVDRDFRRQFLQHIDQRKRGPFRSEHDAQKALAKAIHDTNWNKQNSVVRFCDQIIENMNVQNGEQLSVADQAYNVKELYDFLFDLDYLSPKYELRLGDKNLHELSPGEKGLLLLIFYLQLDRNNTPLIIDQPEDNLDNDSIFKVLANCIRDAKRNRQVVLVTHNPNLAVGADAEQIVYVKLDKSKNHKFSFESGAIENPKITRRIVDVLEGSQPAFLKRRLKYGI